MSSAATDPEIETTCPVCDGEMRAGRQSWRYICRDCGFERSNLVPDIRGETDQRISFDPERHRRAHEPMRRRTYEKILDVLADLTPLGGKRVLDIGSSYGWFAEAATSRGMKVLGLEPDFRAAEIATAAGNEVIAGYFPDDLPKGEVFDVIIFNDVFEHLSDVRGALSVCREHLSDGGLLVLNLPNKKGFLYTTAIVLDRAGVRGPLERLWLRWFPFPHLSFFEPGILSRLLQRASFVELARTQLPVLGHRNLWTILGIDTSATLLARAINWAALSLAIPVLRVLPADNSLMIFRKEA